MSEPKPKPSDSIATLVEDRHKVVRELNGLLDERDKIVRTLNSLTARLAEVERRSIHFAGVWSKEVSYGLNTLTTHSGAMWLSLRVTTPGERPGADGSAWLLTAKSHR